MSYEGLTDEQLREYLKEVDEGDEEVNAFEAGFIDTVVYKYSGPLSPKRRTTAIQIIEKYLG